MLKADKKLEELTKFKQNKRNVYVDFVKNIVRWGKQTYKLTFIKVGDKRYPYVIIKNIEPLTKIKPLIRAINLNKNDLKWTEYEVNGDVYYVVGIGNLSIKAFKNDEEEPEYFFYNTTEGQYLLTAVSNLLNNQSVLS